MVRKTLKALNHHGNVTLTILLISPIPLAIVLLVAESILHPDETLPYIAAIWTLIALGAVVISGLLATSALSAWSYARTWYKPNDTRRLLALHNIILATGLCLVHTIFLAVGISTIVWDETNFARKVFARIGLVDAQYILLIIGISSYMIHKHIRTTVSRGIEMESPAVETKTYAIEDKVDEAAVVATRRNEEAKNIASDVAEEAEVVAAEVAERISERAIALAKDTAESVAELDRKIDKIMEKLERE